MRRMQYLCDTRICKAKAWPWDSEMLTESAQSEKTGGEEKTR